ncbi:MAG: hypothetical protein QXL82_03210 [Candidatus Aenigmatarchaeota archaeon]
MIIDEKEAMKIAENRLSLYLPGAKIEDMIFMYFLNGIHFVLR